MEKTRPLSELYPILYNEFKGFNFICNAVNSLERDGTINKTEHSVLMISLHLERPTEKNNRRYFNSEYYNKLQINCIKNGWWFDEKAGHGVTNDCLHQKRLFLKMLVRKYTENLVVSN
jgi:hypothetical protein